MEIRSISTHADLRVNRASSPVHASSNTDLHPLGVDRNKVGKSESLTQPNRARSRGSSEPIRNKYSSERSARKEADEYADFRTY